MGWGKKITAQKQNTIGSHTPFQEKRKQHY
jgi:hypothetical protein